jgi:hypothetical protein
MSSETNETHSLSWSAPSNPELNRVPARAEHILAGPGLAPDEHLQYDDPFSDHDQREHKPAYQKLGGERLRMVALQRQQLYLLSAILQCKFGTNVWDKRDLELPDPSQQHQHSRAALRALQPRNRHRILRGHDGNRLDSLHYCAERNAALEMMLICDL